MWTTLISGTWGKMCGHGVKCADNAYKLISGVNGPRTWLIMLISGVNGPRTEYPMLIMWGKMCGQTL